MIRALQDLEDEGLLSRRQGSGSFATGEAAAPAAQLLYGMIVPGVSQDQQLYSVFPSFTEALSSLAYDTGAGLVYGSRTDSAPNSSATRMVAVAQHLVNLKVNGVFLVPQHLNAPGLDANRRVTELLSQRKLPVVLLDRDVVDFPQRSRFDLVGVDNHHGGYLLGKHLVDQGCRRLVFISSTECTSTVTARARGCELALTLAGISPLSNWQHIGEPISLQSIEQLLKDVSPDGIFCANDADAGQVLQALRDLNRLVPDEIAVVGFDDVPVARLLPVPLTTVHQPVHTLAKTAMSLMSDRLQNPDLPPRHVLIGCTLIARASSDRSGRLASRKLPGAQSDEVLIQA